MSRRRPTAEATPRELATRGYDALQAGDYARAVELYEASIASYEEQGDELGSLSAKGWLCQACRRAGDEDRSLALALAIVRRAEELGELTQRMKVPVVMAVEEAGAIFLERETPEQLLAMTASILKLKGVMLFARGPIAAWRLRALLQTRAKAEFLQLWRALTEEIYGARESRFPPSEPKLGDLAEAARALGWDATFRTKP